MNITISSKKFGFISWVIIAIMAFSLTANSVLAVTVDTSLSASQDGYSNIAEAVVGRSVTIEASLSFNGGESATLTSWNFQVSPASYTLLSQASVGTITSSSSPTWSLTLNQPGTYTISISPSCSGATCNGDSLTLDAKNSPVVQVTTEDVTLNGGSTVVVGFTVTNSGEAIARGVTASITTPSGVTVSPSSQTVTEPGQESGSITSNGVVTQSFTLTGVSNQVVDGSSFTITVTSANDGTSSATGTISCNNNCYSAETNETTGGTTTGGTTPSTTTEAQEQTFTTLPNSPSLESNPELLQTITEFLKNIDVHALISSSNTLINYVDLTRLYSLDGNEITLNEELTYNYDLKAEKFFVYELLPKRFKQNANNITVITNGVVRIVNQDPGFLIVFENISRGNIFNVSFIAQSDANSSILEDIKTEVYAVFQEEQQPVVQEQGPNVTEEGGNITTEHGKQKIKKSRSWLWILLLIVIIVIAIILALAKKKKPKAYKPKELGHESMIQSLKQEIEKSQEQHNKNKPSTETSARAIHHETSSEHKQHSSYHKEHTHT